MVPLAACAQARGAEPSAPSTSARVIPATAASRSDNFLCFQFMTYSPFGFRCQTKSNPRVKTRAATRTRHHGTPRRAWGDQRGAVRRSPPSRRRGGLSKLSQEVSRRLALLREPPRFRVGDAQEVAIGAGGGGGVAGQLQGDGAVQPHLLLIRRQRQGALEEGQGGGRMIALDLQGAQA